MAITTAEHVVTTVFHAGKLVTGQAHAVGTGTEVVKRVILIEAEVRTLRSEAGHVGRGVGGVVS